MGSGLHRIGVDALRVQWHLGCRLRNKLKHYSSLKLLTNTIVYKQDVQEAG